MTLGDVLKAIGTGWTNLGDVNFVAEGGVQAKLDGSEFRVYDLTTPNAGAGAFLLGSTSVWLSDIFVPSDESASLADLKLTREGSAVARFVSVTLPGVNSDVSDEEIKKAFVHFLFGVVGGWIAYFGTSGGGYEKEWYFSDYDIPEDFDPSGSDDDAAIEKFGKMEADVEKHLKGLGLEA